MHCTVRWVIVAVVVTYSAPAETLERCLASVRASGGVDHIVVVDTGGRARPEGADIEVIGVENRGYGAAANVGFDAARRAGADMIALLNDDVVVAPDWIGPLAAEFVDDRVGAAQPMLLSSGLDHVNSLGVIVGADGAGIDVGAGQPPPSEPTVSDLELFTGGAVLFSAAFLVATGGFDERYFLYYEDVDLARRGAALGWTYRLVTSSVVEHTGGVSTGSDPDRTRYFQERNRLWTSFRFGDPATIARAVWLSVRRLRHAPVGVHGRALASGLAGAPRRVIERAQARRVRPARS